ncbi:MAG: flavodoxin [Bifidobacteriaceae bacterium]|nr:flavodoxin [Bifidobacteriaceae bacterium]
MIIYFSQTNNTRAIATKMQSLLNEQAYEIQPETPYTNDDLNWRNNQSRANIEQDDDNKRPAIATALPDLSSENDIYLGMPLWWGKAPRIIQTFIEQANLTGKTVHLFCTSGSSPIEPALQLLQAQYPQIHWKGAKRFENSATESTISNWLHEINEK